MALLINPSFQAFTSNKQCLRPHIRRAFLRSACITNEDIEVGHIMLEDGTEWQLVVELPVIEELMQYHSCYCIVSFQLWKDGTQHAVARKEQACRRAHNGSL